MGCNYIKQEEASGINSQSCRKRTDATNAIIFTNDL